jgi:hypothetical protein
MVSPAAAIAAGVGRALGLRAPGNGMLGRTPKTSLCNFDQS